MINSKAPISCIMVQLTSEQTNPIVRANFPIGSRIVIPKKKWPYFTKFGFLKMKDKNGLTFTLYVDEVDFIVEKKIFTQTQRHINQLSKDKDKELLEKSILI